MLGLCFFGSFIPIILSRFLHLTRKIFTPLVTGVAVTLIGLTLIKVGMFYMAGGGPAKANGTLGSLQNWAVVCGVFDRGFVQRQFQQVPEDGNQSSLGWPLGLSSRCSWA